MKISRVKDGAVNVITLIVNDAEAADVLAKIGHVKGHKRADAGAKELARRLHDNGKSLRDIADFLAEAGFHGPKGKPYLAGSIAAMLDAT